MYVGLSASRCLLFLWRQRNSSSLGFLLARNLASTRPALNWRNETPSGGLTEVYVYSQDRIQWPDPILGVFAAGDPKFCLPGNIGLDPEADKLQSLESKIEDNSDGGATSAAAETTKNVKLDILEEKTSRELQAQTLYSAHDFIHFTSGAESYVCSEPVLIDVYPSTFANMEHVRFELHEAPLLLKKEIAPLFPGVAALANPGAAVSVITMARETANDMSTWSDEVETEREVLAEQFISLAKELCGRIKSDGYWADFIDPTAGIPYFGQHTNTTMFETDDKYRLLGFRIEDLGCCKVISHKDFGRNVFVGTIVTSVPTGTGAIQDIFKDMNIYTLKAFQKGSYHAVDNSSELQF